MGGNPNYVPKSGPQTPTEWNSGMADRPGEHYPPVPDQFTAPPVPSAAGPSGGGNTTVDTPSLNLFATNMKSLIAPLQAVASTLGNVNVQPGAPGFYHADQIRATVGTVSAKTGIASDYHQVLGDLANGLDEVSQTMQNLGAKYTSTEDANKMSATDLQAGLDTATGYFNKTIADTGGSPGSSGAGGASGPAAPAGSGSPNGATGSGTPSGAGGS